MSRAGTQTFFPYFFYNHARNMTKPLSMILSVHRYTQDKFTPVFDLTYSLNTWSFFNCQKYLIIHSRPCAWTGTLTLQHFRLHDETLTSHARCPRFYPARRRGFHRPGLKIILNDVTLIDTLIEKKSTVPNRRDAKGGGERR